MSTAYQTNPSSKESVGPTNIEGGLSRTPQFSDEFIEVVNECIIKVAAQLNSSKQIITKTNSMLNIIRNNLF